MTPAQWTMLAIAFVAGAIIAGALVYALCRAAGEADDDMADYADEMKRRGFWSL